MSEQFSTSSAGQPAGAAWPGEHRSDIDDMDERAAGFAGVGTVRRDVSDTVRRVMGEGTARSANAEPPGSTTSHSDARISTEAGGAQDDSSTTEVAKGQAAQVADTTKQAGADVVDTVKEQAGQVTAETGRQAKQLLTDAQSELADQAAATQQRAAHGLQSLADELRGMADASEQDGVATDVARQAADKVRQLSQWLEDRDPGTLLDDVRSYARRRPGTYLGMAAGAGVLAGRLTRGLSAKQENGSAAPTASAHIPDELSLQTSGPGASGTRWDALGAQSADPIHSGGQAERNDLWPRPALDPGPSFGEGGSPASDLENSVPLVDDEPAARPVKVAPAPVSGLGATNVVRRPRGDVTS